MGGVQMYDAYFLGVPHEGESPEAEGVVEWSAATPHMRGI
jgi:hypothetical protein